MANETSDALALARAGESLSIGELRDLIRIRSLTGEEGSGQAHIAGLLRALGAEVTIAEPDIPEMFRRFPDVAQYPTHWQHDLILPYAELPTYEALQASGLQSVLNYDGRPNVVGRFRGTGGGRSLILNSHVDTVTVEPLDKWTRDPFGAEIENGIMYGRGTSDMKGGAMAALMAITYLRKAGVTLRGDVIFESVVNEEHAGNGTLDLVGRGVLADAAICLEPTSNTIAYSHPGGLYWRVSVPGVPRSPGARWNGAQKEGVSAVENLPPVIAALLELERSYNKSKQRPANGPAPFSLVMGKISGGHYETVTAGEVVITGGAYFAPQLGDVVAIMEGFRRAIAQANASDPGLRQHPARLEFLHHDDSHASAPGHCNRARDGRRAGAPRRRRHCLSGRLLLRHAPPCKPGWHPDDHLRSGHYRASAQAGRAYRAVGLSRGDRTSDRLHSAMVRR